MLSGQRNKYKLSNANTAFIHQKHLKSFALHLVFGIIVSGFYLIKTRAVDLKT